MQYLAQEALTEIDDWKAKAIEEMADLTPEQRAAESRELRAWLEGRIGTLPDSFPRTGPARPNG